MEILLQLEAPSEDSKQKTEALSLVWSEFKQLEDIEKLPTS